MANLDEENNNDAGHPDDEEPLHPFKRQRVTQACEWCRKKKIKCDGAKPSCMNCRNSSSECIYTEIPRKPRAPKKRTTNIGELENRLERIEYLLEALAPNQQNNNQTASRLKNSSNESRPTAKSGGNKKSKDYVVENQDAEEEQEDQDQDYDDYDENNNNNNDNDYEEDDDDDDGYLRDENIPMTSFISLKPNKDKFLNNSGDMFSISMARGTGKFLTNGAIFSILSKTGMKWVAEKTGDHTLPEKLSGLFSDIHTEHYSRMRPFIVDQGIPPKPSHEALDFVWQLANSQKKYWNELIPLNDLDTMIRAVHDDTQPPNGYFENLLLFSMCALAIPVTVHVREDSEDPPSSNPDEGKRIKKGEIANIKTDTDVKEEQLLYTRGAMYYFHRAMLLPPTFTGLRGLVFLILSLKCSNAHPITSLTPVVSRVAYDLGLHRRELTRGLDEAEADRIRRLFWVVYSLDRDNAMKIGRSPSIMDFDISTELPSPNVVVNDLGVDFDIKSAEVMEIYGDIYESLYSAKGSQQQPAEMAKHVSRLDKRLTDWRDSLPSQYRPGADFTIDAPSAIKTFPTKSWYIYFGVINLHLTYFQLLTNIHRITAYHPSWVSAAINSESNSSSSSSPSGAGNNKENSSSGGGGKNSTSNQSPNSVTSATNKRSAGKYGRLFASLDICVQSARSSIEITKKLAKTDTGFLASSLFFCANSFTTLFIKCLVRPRDMSTNYDLELLYNILELLEIYDTSVFGGECSSGGSKGGVSRFYGVLYDVAKDYAEKCQCGKPSSQGSTPKSTTSDVRSKPSTSNNNNNSKGSRHAEVIPGENGDNNNHMRQRQDFPVDEINPLYNSSSLMRGPMDDSNAITADDYHNGYSQTQRNGFEYPFQAMESSMVQSLYQVPSYFYSWDPEFVVYPDFMMPLDGQQQQQ